MPSSQWNHPPHSVLSWPSLTSLFIPSLRYSFLVEQFRDAKKAILFSSDVSARGMDYPDVTFVLQVGLTDREQYTHRLGRTARAGKGGAGLLLLMDVEAKHMLRTLHGKLTLLCMCICVCVYVCVCIYVYICLCMCICVLCMCVCVCIYMCMCVCVCAK